jgi:glycine/D-amino acid oxidase-like deaminating enzyme
LIEGLALTPVIRICIERHGLNLQTYTPALGLQKTGSSGWKVNTPRGEIAAGLVIATTNAYTGSVLPDFKKKIIPVRGTASSITPAPSHSLAGVPGPLKYTYGFRHGTGDVDYMIPRQGRITPGKGDRSIILGGAKSTFLNNHEEWYDNINDNELMPHARKYFSDFMPAKFAGWTGDEKNVDMVWSGVLGYSTDFKPFVGPHPEKEGVFVCAGFTGHGEWNVPRPGSR